MCMKGSVQSQACGKNSTGSIDIILNQIISIVTCIVRLWQAWAKSGSPLHAPLVADREKTLKKKFVEF